MRLVAGSASDVGMLRTLNEDGLLVATDLFAVADGMGGHRGGEVASARALETFAAAVASGADQTGGPGLEDLEAAVQAANGEVHAEAHHSTELSGMGTTLCAVSRLDDRRVGIVNVGDSRVYLLRNAALYQITEDHSFVETLVREGRLTRAQAEVHPQRNVITRALGIEPYVEVDSWDVEVMTGDRFLLCSDGLFNEVPETDIETLLVGVADPAEVADLLVAAANAAGGRDNVTCVVVDVADVDPSPTPPPTIGRPIADRDLESAVDPDATTVDEPTVDRGASSAAAPGAAIPPAVAGSSASARRAGRPSSGSRRRFTWRTWALLGAIVAVFAVAVIAAVVVNNSTYSIEAAGGQVVIVRGSDNIPLLGTTEISTGIRVADLPNLARIEVERGVSQTSRAAADAYVSKLRTAVAAQSTTTTTTSTTTTTTAPTDTTTTSVAGP